MTQIRDDGETLGLFEPLMIGEGTAARARLSDLAFDLAGASARLVGQLDTSKNLQPQLAGRKTVFENRRILEVFEDRRKQFDAPDDED